MLELNLQGKRAVVTGASLGIGEAVVKMLSDHGASVTFCARNKDAIDSLSKYKPENSSSSIKGLIADMSNGESTENFIEETNTYVKSVVHNPDNGWRVYCEYSNIDNDTLMVVYRGDYNKTHKFIRKTIN